jgi:O-antigen/teichoic acid export membrane protein
MGILIIFYSLDVIIAKIVFSPEIAGTYAIASVLGKIVFWGTLPISKAMLPLTSSNYKSKRKSKNLFMNALGILLIGIVLLLTLFYIFPEILVKLFSGKMLPGAITILFYEGLAFGFISLANLILIYKLSIGKLRGYQFLIIFVLIEISLLSYFSDNLIEFSIAFITSSVAFLWGTIYLLRE